MTVKVPYRRADGSTGVVAGFRVQHNTTRGPAKGGLRYHPGVHLAEVRALAEVMSYKTALIGLPFGGAKGGMAVDPTALTDAEKEDLTRQFVRQLAPLLGPHQDVPAPDAGTDAETMAWIVDEYGRHRPHSLAVVTGKPLHLGGTRGREEATGRGVRVVAEAAMEAEGRTLDGARVVVQGLGNVGGYAAQLLDEAGAQIVGVADATGTLFAPTGFDVRDLLTYVASTGGVDGYARDKAEPIGAADLWRIEADLIVPAALGGVIDAATAHDVQAGVIVEGANLPTTPAADEILARRGITVVPDLLANAGGVLVSYIEWEQNVRQTATSLEETRARLTRILRRRFQEVTRFADTHATTLRTAAYALGLQRLVEGEENR